MPSINPILSKFFFSIRTFFEQDKYETTADNIFRVSGFFAVLLAILILEIFSRTTSDVIPNPTTLLLMTVVYAAFSGGMRSAVFSAGLTIVYALYFFSDKGKFFIYHSTNASRLIVYIIAAPLVAVMVGILKRSSSNREKEHGLRLASEVIPQIVWAARSNGAIEYCNKRWFEYTGLSEKDSYGKGPGWGQVIHPEDKSKVSEAWTSALATGTVYQSEYRMKRRDGIYRWHLVRAVPVYDEYGAITRWFGTCTDIEDQRRNEEAILTMASIVESSNDAIIGESLEGIITSWNGGAQRIYGYTDIEVIGKPISMLLTSVGTEMHKAALESVKKGSRTERLEKVDIHKSGREINVSVTISPIKNPAGIVTGAAVISRDITESKQVQEKMQHQAQHDRLTGLMNKEGLEQVASVVLERAAKTGKIAAVLFIDLDRFKNINDTFGHAIGDKILQEVSQRLSSAVRKEDLIARLGGDEFIVLLSDIDTVPNVLRVAKKILRALESVIIIDDTHFHSSMSIGIAMFPHDGSEFGTLLKNADTALYYAKRSGRNRYQVYDKSMNLEVSERMSLENSLRQALARNELRLCYQPIVKTKDGALVGVEALIRWQHPEHGLIMPADFIAIAEETGLIVPIGKWVIRTACEQHREWMKMGLPNFSVSVNLSARQFNEPTMVSDIVDIVEETGMKPSNLALEVTESIAMENIDRTINKLQELKDHGFVICVDDFGTGYSSLNYLKRFPLDKLKIDKSFVRHITEEQDSTIIRAILSMAQILGLSVIAEGVDSEIKLSTLALLGCESIQGYLISKPISPDDLVRWIRDRQAVVRV